MTLQQRFTPINRLRGVGGSWLGLALAVGCFAQGMVRAASPPTMAGLNGIWIDDVTPHVIDTLHDAPPPPYNAQWMAKYLATRAQFDRGEEIYDPVGHCLPPGMPAFDRFFYPLEILVTPGQVTLLTEFDNLTRRIFTDGRSHPSGDDLEPTFRGHSIGHWEHGTLVADTVGVRDDTLLGLGSPHSDQMRVVERWHLKGNNTIELQLTVEDPIALTHPWVRSMTLHRAAPGTEVREFVCEESRRYASAPRASSREAGGNR